MAKSKQAVFIIAVNRAKKAKYKHKHLWMQCLEEPAKYNAEYYQKHQYSINRNKAVKRGNSRKQKLKETIVQKWNIKWDPSTGKYY